MKTEQHWLQEFEVKRLKHLVEIQERMMLLMSALKFDRETEDEDEEESEYDEDEDRESPIHSELFTLMELYKVITIKVE